MTLSEVEVDKKVQLVNGSPVMTIAGIREDFDDVIVEWVDKKKKIQTSYYPADSLMYVE